jgi:hypothetical protein
VHDELNGSVHSGSEVYNELNGSVYSGSEVYNELNGSGTNGHQNGTIQYILGVKGTLKVH